MYYPRFAAFSQSAARHPGRSVIKRVLKQAAAPASLSSLACWELLNMATFTPKGVKDVPPNDFIKAYAAHLKASGKVHNTDA